MSSPSTVYFISGAGRGIGLGLVKSFAARSDSLVFAGARAPEKADALNELAKATGGRVVVVKLDAGSDEDHKAAVELVKQQAGRVDVVIANAGIAEGPALTATGPPEAYSKHFATNVVGPLRLFQALLPLLQASSKPQFLAMSSAVGSNTLNLAMPNDPYGVSKAALNFLVTKIASEHGEADNLTAWVTHPGLVATDMGNLVVDFYKAQGVDVPFVTVDESVAGLTKLVDNATRETMGGKFVQYDGAELPW
ncbi:hypothetical protein JCM3775_006317 [Rhodotorula graminis]